MITLAKVIIEIKKMLDNKETTLTLDKGTWERLLNLLERLGTA